jgi:hypothetical protein
MADVAHTMPAAVLAKEGTTVGFARPGLQVTPFVSGRILTRDWHGYNIREYGIDPILFDASDTTLEEWETFWHQIDGGAEAGHVVEAISGTHRKLLCGGLGDGSKTTFPIPVVAPTSVTVFVNGVPQESSAYTLHTAANMLDDNYANPTDAGDYSDTNGSDEIVTGVSVSGLRCLKFTPDGVGSTEAIANNTGVSVSVGESYTALAACLETASSARNFRVGIRWYDSGPSYLSTSWGTNTASPTGTWTMYSSGANAAVASAAYARPVVQCYATGTTDICYHDCFAICPGDYTRWHLPSQAPGLIEFASAPAAGARITATATGQRATRCRFSPGTSWSLSSPGHAAVRSINATEWVEF